LEFSGDDVDAFFCREDNVDVDGRIGVWHGVCRP
jgi:hypothetical protein